MFGATVNKIILNTGKYIIDVSAMTGVLADATAQFFYGRRVIF